MSDEAPTHKQCTKCGETKILDAFRVAAGKYGRRAQCKECEAIIWAENYRKRRAYFADYYVTNKKRIREIQRSYERINYRTISEAKRPYRLAYYISNRERIHEKRHAYRMSNPEHSLELARLSNHRRRARVKGNGGTFTVAELRAMKIEYAGVCFYCRGQHDPDELTIDQGGRHEAANIVLACGICNSSKGNRRPDQWTDRWYERKQRAKRK